MKFRPDSLRMRSPISALVPARRMTMGISMCTDLAAATTPLAMVSHFMMPPKMLMSTDLTFGSFLRMVRAAFTCPSVAPPPTSRKLAGEPPCMVIMSNVAMARPAPLTRHPMDPSRPIKLRSCLDASTSRGSSSVVSRMAKISSWRNDALSSKASFASKETMSPSGVSTNGLISTCVQSLASNNLYRAAIWSAASCDLAPKPSFSARARSCPCVGPVIMSMGSLMMASGFDSATSSMSTPPSDDATITGPPYARSSKMAK
mmetsp:Transcript_9635/g.30531  ORF Transcript_9635/g.30531 Transcript_9635/m.30531 type:complete len:260 (+) Transcript_9635:555-1334(+)